MEWFYLNGELVERQNAMLPVEQTGILRSYGIFDFFRTIQSQPRFFEDYIDRFSKSQKFLGLSRLITEEEIREAVRRLQEKNQFEESYFKLVLLGDGPDGADVYEPFFYIMNMPLRSARPDSVGVITHEYVREHPEIKSLNYMTTFSLTKRKAEMKAAEVVFHDQGVVSEASRCNVFVIKDGVLRTPIRNILHGITRKHVIEAARSVMEVREEDVSPADLLSADEVFITSTTKDVMPVTHIDGHVVATGRPGEWSHKLQKTFEAYYHDLVGMA